MDKKQGSVTIEASIALTMFIFIVMSILGFAAVFRAQSIVSHATLQTGQSLAIESYYRETISSGSDSAKTFSMLLKFAGLLGMKDLDGADDWYQSLGDKGTDFYSIVKSEFANSIAEDAKSADQILKDAGIKDGLDGIDFTYSSVGNGEIIINVQYNVKLPFSFFGERTIPFSKTSKTKAFKKINDDNGYKIPKT